jgi:hypothetical protein
MNPLASYIRALIMFYLGQGAVKFGLPVEGLSAAMEFVANCVVLTLVWLVTKYGKDIVAKMKGGGTSLWLLLLVPLCLGLSSCTIAYDPGTGKWATTTDPNAVEAVVNRLNERLNDKLNEPLKEPAPKGRVVEVKAHK